MCVLSKESNRSPNIFPINASLSPMFFDAPRLSSGSSCSTASENDNYVEDDITLVTNFRSLRDIKAEIDFTSKRYILEGKFGRVSRAHLQDDSMVAIKEIKEHVYKECCLSDDAILTKIWNEAANGIKLKDNPRFVEL